jgi:D-lactate dehydrogenase
MRIAMFSSKGYDKTFFESENRAYGHDISYLEARLTLQTTMLTDSFPAVCVFVNDVLDAAVLRDIHERGVSLVALRCAGFNNVDIKTGHELGMKIVRVPAYSPHAVAEHTVGIMLALNRKIHRAYGRVREGNFALEGLLGFDMRGKTVGIIGTGKIGQCVAEILNGFGCRLCAYDPYPNQELVNSGVKYVSLRDLLSQSDIITLHCPLMPETYHIIDDAAIRMMKPGVMLINTSRGALINTPDVIDALKDGILGYLGLDVYEEEGDLFFEDLSEQVIQDDVFSRLLTFPNVIVTGHQAFFTSDAMRSIAQTTLANVSKIENGEPCENEVTAEHVRS